MRLFFFFLFIITASRFFAQPRTREKHWIINPTVGYTGFKNHYLDIGAVRNWRNDTAYALVHYELLVGATMDKTKLGTTTLKIRAMIPWFHIIDIGVISRLYTDFSSCNLAFGPELGLGQDHSLRFCYSYQWKANNYFTPQISPHCFSLYVYLHANKKR